MKHTWLAWMALLAVALGALLFRLPWMADRPMHGDEAIHADKFRELWEEGDYKYDSFEYHGPTLNYSTLPIMWLGGYKDFVHSTELTYRLTTVIYGAALVLLLGLLAKGMGWGAVLAAAVFTAISPAMVFYSRYYIQEMLLVFFMLLTLVGGWRFSLSGRWGWAILCGLGVGLMHATKETWVIPGVAMVGAIIATTLWTRIVDGRAADWKRVLRPLPLALAALAGIVVAIVLLTGFFAHWSGPLDSVWAYGTYFHRGTAEGLHDHPWHYYLQIILCWCYGIKPPDTAKGAGDLLRYLTDCWRHGRAPIYSEALIVGLALVGMMAALWPLRWRLPVEEGKAPADHAASSNHVAAINRRSLGRFLTFYTLAMVVGYSFIRYKTPWCMLGFLHGLILLAGLGAADLLRWARPIPLRVIVGLLLAAGTAQLGYQAYRFNYVRYSDRTNPLVYAHPSLKMMELVERIHQMAAVSPAGKHTLVRVITLDCWPLPWYLRDMDQVGYTPKVVPGEIDAPIVITSMDLEGEVNAQLTWQYTGVEYFGLRPGVPLAMHVQADLWRTFLKSRGAR